MDRRRFIKALVTAGAAVATGGCTRKDGLFNIVHAENLGDDGAIRIGGDIPYYNLMINPHHGRGGFEVWHLHGPYAHAYNSYPLKDGEHNLVTEIEQQKDGWWFFTLKEKVIAHNGEVFNQIVFCHSLDQKLSNGWDQFHNSKIPEYHDIKGRNQVALKIRNNFPLELLNLGNYLHFVTLDTFRENAWDGHGPYMHEVRDRKRIEELIHSEDGLFQPAFGNYHMGHPNNPGLNIKRFPSHEGMIAALEMGNLDVIPLGKAFQPQEWEKTESGIRYAKSRNMMVVERTKFAYPYAIIPNTGESSVFSDPDILRAFFAAISNEGIKQRLRETGVQPDALRPPVDYFPDERFVEGPDNHDGGLAKELMKNKLINVVISDYKNPSEYVLPTILNYLIETMKEYGFNITVVDRSNLPPGYEPDAHIRIGGGMIGSFIGTYNNLHSGNLWGYSNKKVDEILDNITKKEQFNQIQTIMAEQGMHPVVAMAPRFVSYSTKLNINWDYIESPTSAEFLTSAKRT